MHAASHIPGSSLFGRRDDPAASARLTVRGTLSRGRLGEFAWRPRSGAVRAVFVRLDDLQRTLGLAGRVNAVLAAVRGGADLQQALLGAARLEDLGLRLRTLPAARALQLETTSALLGDALAATASDLARRQGLAVTQVLVYLANTLRAGEREVPYSLVAAVDEDAWRALAGGAGSGREGRPPEIVLNDWTASRPGGSTRCSRRCSTTTAGTRRAGSRPRGPRSSSRP